jgi:DNA polymerase III epsilon subunit-like protein
MATTPPVHPLPAAAANDYAEREGLVDAEPSAPAKLCIVRIETSGLEPDRHEVWEIALIRGDDEYLRHLEIDPSKASSEALRKNGYYDRHPAATDPDWRPKDPEAIAAEVAKLTAGAHLVGVNPAFDATFLGAFCRRYKAAPAWEYHLVDVLPLVAGRFQVRPPWSSHELSLRLGIQPPGDDARHTAIAEARWARQMYEAVMFS